MAETMAMSEADMEQYAQMLDELCEKDPQAYEQLMQMMREQVEGAALGSGSEEVRKQLPGDTAASMMERIKSAVGSKANDTTASDGFKPVFPGNKVMEKDGIAAKQEGIHIDVTPGFVMKTTDMQKKQKVFVNICHSSAIQSFSQRKQLDEQGNEQEGMHVPLSLGAPHEVLDKSGTKSVAFDVAVNTQVVDDCERDPTGAFRNFVCELAIEYIAQKYKVQLDLRYKLPKLTYRGTLPPPKHYIRKEQKPIIEEVSPSTRTPAPSASTKKKADEKKAKPETATATYEIYELTGRAGDRVACSRVAAVDATGTALSREMLERAGSHLAIRIRFQTPITTPEEIALELRAEHLGIKVEGHRDLAFYMPFPVVVDEATVTLDPRKNVLELVAPIDKTWVETEPDCGSAPWLLAHALRDEEDMATKKGTPVKQTAAEPEPPKSLVEMFHLAMPSSKETVTPHQSGGDASTRPQWDPVDEDEELPEDRFHRKDMMSMHILEQRKKERQQKATEADAKRKTQRAEVERKQRQAKEAGKSWREMYPDEPETTYVDFEEIAKQQDTQCRRENAGEVVDADVTKECIATDTAKQVAAAWSIEKEAHGLTLESALAFDLLD